MSSIAVLKEQQKIQSGRLWTARWQIRSVEKKYADLPFDIRRNIHLRGSKARFLLAGSLQYQASQNKYIIMPISSYDPEAYGPHELCPIIDIYQAVRIAQSTLDEWLKHPASHSIAHLDAVMREAEKVAWDLQVLFTAIERGGDETPPLSSGTETFSEFCSRLHTHHTFITTTRDGYGKRWHEVPSNDGPLSSQQIASNWNAVCCLVMSGMPLEAALSKVRRATREMVYEELAWPDQKREWFAYVPKLEAGGEELLARGSNTE